MTDSDRDYLAEAAARALAILDEDGDIDAMRYLGDPSAQDYYDHENPRFPHDPYGRAVLALRQLRDTARGEGTYNVEDLDESAL